MAAGELNADPAQWDKLADLAAEDAGAEWGPWAEARYEGTCGLGCGYRWEPGEQIRLDLEENAWACFGCATAETS